MHRCIRHSVAVVRVRVKRKEREGDRKANSNYKDRRGQTEKETE